MPYTLQNSTFLDAFGANLYTDAQYQQLVNGNIELDFTSAHGHGWLA
jgi:hypothetical protein